MKIVPLKCPGCGASVDFSEGKKIAFCPYCGSKMFLDDEKRQIELSGKVEVSGIASLDRLCISADTFIRIGDEANADRVINEIYLGYPDDYRGYLLAMKLRLAAIQRTDMSIQNASKYDLRQISEEADALDELFALTDKALTFAPAEAAGDVKQVSRQLLQAYLPYISNAEERLAAFRQQEKHFDEQYQQKVTELESVDKEFSTRDGIRRKNRSRYYLSLLIMVAAFFSILLHPAFVLLFLITFVFAIVFGIKLMISTFAMRPIRAQLNQIKQGMNTIRQTNGFENWPNGQLSEEDLLSLIGDFRTTLARVE